jgi:hypothetical protein
MLLILFTIKAYSQPTKNTDTCSTPTESDKRIWNIVWLAHNQFKETIKDKDSVIMFQDGIMKQDSIKLKSKDTELGEQGKIIVNQTSRADRAIKGRNTYMLISGIELGVIILMLIIR